MERKLLFFDIDGTLLDEEKKLPASTEQAIQELQQEGHYTAIATGRAPFMFERLRRQLNIESFISFNGSYVEFEGRAVRKVPLDEAELQRLTHHATENDHPVVYLDHRNMKANVPHHPHIEKSLGSLKFDHPEFDDTYLHNRDIYQSLLFCVDGEEKEYEQEFGKFDFIRWHEVSTDVLPSGGSKALGIEAVMNELGMQRDDVYVFGDGPNDVEMLEFTKNSVAMGNAVPQAAAAASHHTDHVGENGIANALKAFGLIK
ncbi:Cof-type HAD-IIB family hydrolase [Alkalicoccus urumqiensis]|uniref:Cof-type HAD-IIB family hydrolase n=1 Tax=Alkalicoccus urumqiensis TaxID=1548213 RepID=A0A2P6MK38_ALKUR|nr:Cof-type HAD-IIB family hydrolase [Alkalicoccus urumqiensis]PRO66631.1 Cof-type HAD-IIB family hydrolase [Alkalicoccus urumqiensis]